MPSAFKKFYDHVFAVLKNDVPVRTIVTTESNIRPSDDPEEPKPGPMIHYSWSSAAWDTRQKRGTGIFNITAASPDNSVKATELLELIGDALTPKALTAAAALVRVHKFKENEALTDLGVSESERHEAVTSYDVRLVEV